MKKIITSLVVASLAMTPVPSFAKKKNSTPVSSFAKKKNSIYLAIIPVVLLALLASQKGSQPRPASP